MKPLILVTLLLCLPFAVLAQQSSSSGSRTKADRQPAERSHPNPQTQRKLFPYDYTIDDLRPHLAATCVTRTVLVEAARCDDEETREFLALASRTP